MKRLVVIAVLLASTAGLFWFFPLFHIVPLDRLQAPKQGAEFDAKQFAGTFWTERLVPALDQAADAATVLAALRENPQAAGQRFGRASGLGRARLYLLRGEGTVVSIEKNGVGVSLMETGREPDIVLQTGLLFGNTARDATGLLNPGDFADSRQFNDVSTELNRIIETQVISPFKGQAQLGRSIQFVGCAQITHETGDLKLLKLIPLRVTGNER